MKESSSFTLENITRMNLLFSLKSFACGFKYIIILLLYVVWFASCIVFV